MVVECIEAASNSLISGTFSLQIQFTRGRGRSLRLSAYLQADVPDLDLVLRGINVSEVGRIYDTITSPPHNIRTLYIGHDVCDEESDAPYEVARCIARDMITNSGADMELLYIRIYHASSHLY